MPTERREIDKGRRGRMNDGGGGGGGTYMQ